MTKAHIVLADGTVFEARTVGAPGIATGEAVFTTGMTGYEEVLSDPSYCGQLVTMTAPQMGNTGVNGEDLEAEKPFLSGFIVHEMARMTSNWRTKESLPDYLKSRGIVAVDAVDTRSLTRHIRDHGAQMAAMGSGSIPELLEAAKAAPPMEGLDLSAVVSTKDNYEWSKGSDDAWRVLSSEGQRPHVVALDFGVKRNILRCLVDAGCR
ncbi:MAG: carbamoyl-phosphate synthase small subunit, partial [Polyangiales bacterium]